MSILINNKYIHIKNKFYYRNNTENFHKKATNMLKEFIYN